MKKWSANNWKKKHNHEHREENNRLDMQEGSERTIGRNTFKQERTIAEEGMKANGNTIA